MRPEFDIEGVFISSAAATGAIAFLATIVLRKLLGRTGLYHHVWHPALFETALFVLLWAAITALPFGI